MFNFEYSYAKPGMTAQEQTTEAAVFWGPKEMIWPISALISGAARDAGNSPTDVLRAGLLMGKVTATGVAKEWNPTGTDGSQFIMGVMAYDQKMQQNGTDVDRWSGHIVPFGRVKGGSIIIPGEAAAGIDGHANELLVRAQMSYGGL
jgi:hypothetical protein